MTLASPRPRRPRPRLPRFGAHALATLASLGTLATSACTSYNQSVTLVVPAESAPFAERSEAYRKLRPVKRGTTTINGVLADSQVVLADGTHVRNAADLVPAVRSDSATARSVHAAESARKTGAIITWTSVGVGLVGGILTAVAFGKMGSDGSIDTGTLGAGVGCGVAGSIGVMVGAYGFSPASDEQAAFDNYEKDLQTRLGIEVEP